MDSIGHCRDSGKLDGVVAVAPGRARDAAPPPGRFRRLLCALTLLAGTCLAQSTPPSEPADADLANIPTARLHVYTDLEQIPTLVLRSDRSPAPPIPESRFTVRIDEGPPFHPSHVRIEGDDPLELALLLDTNDRQTLSAAVEKTIALLPPLLQPHDTVWLYALDCAIGHLNAPGTHDPDALTRQLHHLLETPALHGAAPGFRPCRSGGGRLWDAIAMAAQELPRTGSRRVILVVSNGVDHGSGNRWRVVEEYAAISSIAVFGIREPAQFTPMPGLRSIDQTRRYADPLDMLCADTGGIVLDSSAPAIQSTLGTFFRMVRNRYILEFPRPRNSTSGSHTIEVQTADSTAIVRPSGITVPLPDPAVLGAPDTIPSDPTRGPIQGSHRRTPPPN